MRIRVPGRIAAAGLMLAAAPIMVVSGGEGPRLAYQVITEEELETDLISPMARKVLVSGELLIGRSDRFIALAKDVRGLSHLINEAEFALDRSVAWFDLPASSLPPGVLIGVDDESVWRRLVRRYGLRDDGLALKTGRELYFRGEAGEQQRPDRIAHEVVHFYLAETFANRLPLWLDEGLAGHYGWLAAAEYRDRTGITLSRHQPAMEAKQLLSLDNLLLLDEYPREPSAVQVFYRQTAELVGVLAERLGPEGMIRFVQALAASGAGTPEAFREAAGLDETQYRETEMLMLEKSRTERRTSS